MITQVAKLTWKASADMTPAMIPNYLDSVIALGGKNLIFRNMYINAIRAVENRTILKKCISQAKDCLDKHLAATNEGDSILRRMEAKDAIIRAGAYSCFYMFSISPSNAERIYSDVPDFVINDPELKESWDQGFSRAENY